jgi:hypothetical protein
MKMRPLRAGGNAFVIEDATVRGVVGIDGMAELAGAPEFVRGIVWFEGEGLPVIDLKARVGLGRTAVHRRSCVAVVELVIRGAPLTLGMLVDSELDVMAAMTGATGEGRSSASVGAGRCCGGRNGKCMLPSVGRRRWRAAGRMVVH